jgi:hypothetical protein
VFEVRYDPATRTASFEDRSYNLGDQPILALAVYGPTGNLYAATDFGVLELPAGSTEWVEAGNGLPHVATYGLALSEDGRVLYAATHGRGAYSLELPARPGPEPPGGEPGPTPDTSPSAELQRIKPVELGKRSTIRGKATDPGGIDEVRIRFGDGGSRTIEVGPDNRFHVRHRYDESGRFKVRLTVTGLEGKRATAKRNARVKPPAR